MRHASFLGPGGQFKYGMRNCKKEAKNSAFQIPNSELGGARWARLILRKHRRVSDSMSYPADAFSSQCPWFRARILLLAERRIAKVKVGKA
jgi:hypothetical protein